MMFYSLFLYQVFLDTRSERSKNPLHNLLFSMAPTLAPIGFPDSPGVALEGPKNAPSEAQEGPEREKPYKTPSKSNVFVYSPLGFGGPPGVLRCLRERFL